MPRGLDSPKSVADRAAQLAAAGYAWVGRYLFDRSSFKDLLTHAEAAAITRAGLSIVTVWENGFPTNDPYFTAGQGRIDAVHAAARAQAAGQPAATPIYFAVDGDIDPAAAVPYFEAIRAALRGVDARYSAGVYGSGAVCAHLTGLGLVSHTWLSQSRGWRGYDQESPHADIRQGPETSLGAGPSASPSTASTGGAGALDIDLDLSPAGAGSWKVV